MDSAEEFRISLTVKDFEKTLAFYGDVLGLQIAQDWTSEKGKCVLFSIGKATLEIIDEDQSNMIDSVEVGKRVSGQVRFAIHFPLLEPALALAKEKGAKIVHEPVETPWKDVNARLLGPDGMQMTFYQSPAQNREMSW